MKKRILSMQMIFILMLQIILPLLTVISEDTNDSTVSAATTVWNFGCTKGMQSLTIPEDGIYRLQVWGAEGSACTYSGGPYPGGKRRILYRI